MIKVGVTLLSCNMFWNLGCQNWGAVCYTPHYVYYVLSDVAAKSSLEYTYAKHHWCTIETLVFFYHVGKSNLRVGTRVLILCDRQITLILLVDPTFELELEFRSHATDKGYWSCWQTQTRVLIFCDRWRTVKRGLTMIYNNKLEYWYILDLPLLNRPSAWCTILEWCIE